MTYNINELINYFVKHRNDVPIQETIFINSIISSLE